jgi:cellulose synthase operon protein C
MLFLDKPSTKTVVRIAALVLGCAALAACGSREQRAQNYYEQGMSYLTKKDYVKAGIEFKNALQIKGDLVPAFRGMAQVDEHNGNLQALAGDLRSIADYSPKDLDSRVNLARLYLLGGALDSALKVANEAVALAPDKANVVALKAVVLFRLKDMDGGAQAAQQAIKLDPSNLNANSVLGAIKFVQGDPSGALQILQNVATDQKNDPGLLLLKVSIYDRTGDAEQVETLLRQLVSQNPNEPSYRNLLVKFYVAHQRGEDAIKELRAFAAAKPDDLRPEIELLGVLESLKGKAAVRSELNARINAGGNVFPYQIALAKLDFNEGNTTASEDALKKLISAPKSPDDAMVARGTLAEMYLQKNNISAAEPLISEMLRLDPRNTTGLRLRAGVHVVRGQFDDAINDLRTALNDEPQSPALLASLGIAYERNGSIDLADKAYYDATKASKFSPDVGLNYVAFLQRRSLADQAERVLNDLAARNPNNVEILSALAKAKLARQDWAGAHAIAETIGQLNDPSKKSVIANEINAAAFTGEKKFGESLTALQSVFDANPGDIKPMAELVDVYMRAQQPDKAVSFLQAALKANPANAEALVLMGQVQLAKHDPGEAEKNFEEAIKQQPKKVVGYDALVRFYASQKKYDEALKIVRAGLEQQPDSFDLQLGLAGMLEARGEFEPAITQYESMMKVWSGSLIVVNNLASLLADHRTDEASLQKAGSLALTLKKSEVPQFKDTVGWISYRRGDYTAAVPLLEDAAARLPDNAWVRYHLGMTYLAVGQSAKATAQFQAALNVVPKDDAELKAKIDTALKTPPEKVKG